MLCQVLPWVMTANVDQTRLFWIWLYRAYPNHGLMFFLLF